MTITATEPSTEMTEAFSPPTTVHGGNLQNPGHTGNLETTGDDDDDDDDDVTVIILEHGQENQNHPGWADQDSPELEERRRNVLLRELQRVQRASFIQFWILCLIPTSLLLLVVVAILGDDEECESLATTCTREPRTFVSAYTSRCVCEAITIISTDNSSTGP